MPYDPSPRSFDLTETGHTVRRGRYVVSGGLVAEFAHLRLTLPVRNLSRGGFGVQSRSPFEPECVHDVVLRCAEQSTPMSRVRVVYANPAGGSGTLLVGFQFLDANHPRLRAAVTTMVRTLGCLDAGPSD